MVASLSLASLLCGGALAGVAHRFPRRQAAIEICGGALLVGGLALLGASLPRL